MKTKIRILHIDDNIHDRQLVKDALQKEHDEFEVAEAGSREKFEQHLAEGDFDIILSDFNILGFDGLQVLQIVKEKNPDMPVIIVTGTGSEEIAIQAMKMGAADYVIKTAKHISGLAPTIKSVLRFKKTQDERNRAEEEIHQLNESLEQRVFERTSQLSAVNKELEAFSYSVSHDLKAPLRAIDGFVSILQEGYSDLLDNEGNRIINVIRSNVKKMRQLISDLLDFSRISGGELHKTNIEMESLVHSVYNEFKLSRSYKQITFTVESLPVSRGDNSLIRQVWINLISNALKYSSKKEHAHIQIGIESNKDEVIYYIKDNGIGFDMNYVDKLFGVFQRLHKTEEFEGTGIGLAIVQRIINRHGGRVWAKGEVNIGATFYFSLPK